MDAARWDERYRAERGLWGSDVAYSLRAVLAALDAGDGTGRRVVDLAAGAGRHALWLATRGWQATAVDFSAEAIEQGRVRGAESGVEVDWQVGDAMSWEPASSVDLVLIAFLHLPRADTAAIVGRARSWLTPTGSVVYVGHAQDNLEHGTGGPQDADVLPTVADLAGAVDGAWVRMLSHVLRPVEGGPDAIDVVVWASPWHSGPTGATGPASASPGADS